MATRNLTIMFTDIKGYTARTSDSTRDDVRSLLDEHAKLLKPVFRHFDGTVVKTIGDAFLVYFESPTDGVVCGLTIQSVLKKYNNSVDEKNRISVRVALNVGDVEMIDGDVLGEPVNIAARLESITEPDEVWFTEAVYLTMNRKEAPSTEIGERTFRGIPIPVRVYRVVSDPPTEQIKQIDRSVRIERGVLKLEGLRPPQAARTSWKLWAAAGILALIAGPLLGVLSYEAMENRKAQKRIETLLAIDDPVTAYAAVDAELSKRPEDPELRMLGLKTAEMTLDRRLQRGDPKEDVLKWLFEEIKHKGYLASLHPRYAHIDAELKLMETMKSRRGDHSFWAEFRKLIEQYPEYPEIAVAALDVLKKSNKILETRLWPHEIIIERSGGLPDDESLREDLLETILHTIGRQLPATGYARRAHSLGEAHFKSELKEWAEKQIDEGSGIAILNALQILENSGDFHSEDLFYKALKAISKADADPKIITYLQDLDDEKKIRKFLDIFNAGNPASQSGVSPENRELFRNVYSALQDSVSD